MYNEAKMQQIYSNETLNRIQVYEHPHHASIDLHGMQAKEARMLIKSMLIFHGDLKYIRAIHGYHKGTAIRETIRKQFAAHPNVIRMVTPQYNPGETVFVFDEVKAS